MAPGAPQTREKRKKCTSLEDGSAKARSQESEAGQPAKRHSLESGKERPGLLERAGQQWRQRLGGAADGRRAGRKIGIFKERCLEMADETVDFTQTSFNQERSDFLGGRGGIIKQKQMELTELPEILGNKKQKYLSKQK